MSVRLVLNDKQFKQTLKKATASGLLRATTHYHTLAKLAVNAPNSGVRVKVTRQTPGGNKRSRTIYPNPSRPGEPPRKRTGFGQKNIVKEFDAAIPAGRVGIARNGIYMLYLELGTRRIKPRPWLVATLMKNKDMIGRLAATGGKS